VKGSADVPFDHYVSWHTGDGVAADLRGELTPLGHNLIDNADVLALHALSSAALAALAEIDDGVLRRLDGVDFNLVEGVLGGGHGVSRLLCNYRAWERPVDAQCATTSPGIQVTTCPVSVLQQPLTLFNHQQVETYTFGRCLE